MNKYLVVLPLLFTLAVCQHLHANEVHKPLRVEPLTDGVYVHTSYKHFERSGWIDSNGLVVVHQDQAFIVDTPWSETDTELLLKWIAGQGWQLQGSISTHFHDDRTAGIALLNSKSIPTYTSKMTDEILLEKGKTRALNSFSGESFEMLGGRVQAFYPVEGHAKDNLVIWLPEQQVLFGGCLIRSFEWGSLGFTGDASIGRWASSVQKVKDKFNPITLVVPGHGKPGDATMLDHTMGVVEQNTNK
ncbi:MAG: subclass B1 metallo-beta-lactamase [Arenicella sp.]|jgi:glyoxylase-like metal-dependent hydrolase (beta-lactamase superfamily II)|nr:subclass B1 metallo-beta-lactamase [Arenicella sp.]